MRNAWALPLLLVGCAGAPHDPASPSRTPVFDPFTFFAGHTEGSGTLHIVLTHRRAIRVHGSGDLLPDGSLRLAQTVDEEGKPPTRREWRLTQTGPGQYVGSLTSAVGPVGVAVDGDRLHIRFHMAHGLATEQWLALQPGAQATQNHLTVRKFGVVIATLDEKIVRVP